MILSSVGRAGCYDFAVGLLEAEHFDAGGAPYCALDGFESVEAVIVPAATNRPDLDPVLLRLSRFDRRARYSRPDWVGRCGILEVHTRSIPLADGVDLEALAATMAGMVGADLANLAYEAALPAAPATANAFRLPTSLLARGDPPLSRGSCCPPQTGSGPPTTK